MVDGGIINALTNLKIYEEVNNTEPNHMTR
jgi:hypothetical protein